jgi:DNA modification methylase
MTNLTDSGAGACGEGSRAGIMSDITIIHGDCQVILPTLEVGTVGAVVMDPPYGISHSSNKGASWEGTQIENDSDTSLRDWAIGWAEERGLPWASFGSWKQPRPIQTRAVLIWDKGPAFGMGDLSFPWKLSWEEIYIGGQGWKGPRDEGVLRGHILVSWESKGRKHPHQKPVSLMSHLISKLPREATILDPFAGTGSTLVACMKAGRRGIGIELDERYIPVIERRVEAAETPLFQGLGVDILGE